jgi:hypothetical protein
MNKIKKSTLNKIECFKQAKKKNVMNIISMEWKRRKKKKEAGEEFKIFKPFVLM